MAAAAPAAPGWAAGLDRMAAVAPRPARAVGPGRRAAGPAGEVGRMVAAAPAGRVAALAAPPEGRMPASSSRLAVRAAPLLTCLVTATRARSEAVAASASSRHEAVRRHPYSVRAIPSLLAPPSTAPHTRHHNPHRTHPSTPPSYWPPIQRRRRPLPPRPKSTQEYQAVSTTLALRPHPKAWTPIYRRCC